MESGVDEAQRKKPLPVCFLIHDGKDSQGGVGEGAGIWRLVDWAIWM